MVSETQLVYMAIQIIYIILGIAFFFGLYLVSSYILKYLKRNRHKRLLNSTEYLPKEETQTLKQVFYLIIITLCFVDILYSLVFWSSDDFYRHFIFYDVLVSLICCLAIKKDTLTEKIIMIFLIPLSSLLHSTLDDPAILLVILLAVHFIGLAYVIKVYYGKFIHFTESNGLGISILLLFGLVFVSFIFTSFAEGKNLLDSLVMVSNAFTSNGYAVLGDTPIGKLNSLFLVWGGYILSGVGTATLTTALLSRHFNKRFEELEELIKNNNDENADDLKKDD
ncbi:hypothetical protein [uncultured Methanobrevibacter sp.]|uniref:hypothetical protein n=1 Tax=uncultured Methanobrevibacter sp. TaxID=253161 RepID=UPI0025CF8FD4|nr:hypothetical protein [uncultured Methanobrevibacter sp.]